MEALAQLEAMEAEDQSCQSAKSLFLSEAFVFVVCLALLLRTQNTHGV